MSAHVAALKTLYNEGRIEIEACAWPAYPGDCTTFGILKDRHVFDVVVVGAGLAGGSLALHLTEGGAKVALIDAAEPGWGASGRNAGNVSACGGLLPEIRTLPNGGSRFLQLLSEHGDLPFRLVKKHNIDCDAVQGGSTRVARRSRDVILANDRVKRWRDVGMNVRLLDRDEVHAVSGSRRYLAGVMDERGGRINPFYFTRGLATAARMLGAAVFAKSPVIDVTREAGRWCVKTASGRAIAERVVLCTGAYGKTLNRSVDRAFTSVIAYGLATRPLPDSIRRVILPQGGTMLELPTGFHPALVDGLGRLITSLIPGANAHSPRVPMADVSRWFADIYPQFENFKPEFESYWTGVIAYSGDMLPRVLDLGQGMLALNGLSTGNVYGPVLGMDLASGLLKDSLDGLAIPLTKPESIGITPAIVQSVIRYALVPLVRGAERLGL